MDSIVPAAIDATQARTVSREPGGPHDLDDEPLPAGGVDFAIDLALPDEEGNVPVVYRFASFADATRYHDLLSRLATAQQTGLAGMSEPGVAAPSALDGAVTRLVEAAGRFSPEAIAVRIARVLAPQLKQLVRPVVVPPDDAFVDQDSGLYDRGVYLRLAREGAFQAKTVGKKRIAQWRDVKAAFIKKCAPITVAEPTDDPEADLLNEIRQRAGLAIKGGR